MDLQEKLKTIKIGTWSVKHCVPWNYWCNEDLGTADFGDSRDTRSIAAIRYKGINPTKRNSVINVNGATILLRTSLIMFNKVANVLSIVSFVMVASMSGGAYFGYKYVTSEQFKSRVMSQIMKEVQTILPGQINKKLPSVTGESLPL